MASQNLSIQCDRVLPFYSFGDVAEFRFSGKTGTPCEISFSGPIRHRKSGILPMAYRVPLDRTGIICCELTAGNETASLKIFVNPEEIFPKTTVQTRQDGYQRYGSIVNEYYVARFRAIAKERSERIAKIKTKKAAEQYVREVRTKIRKVFALDPEENTPLNAKIVSVKNYPHYRMENLIFESRPGYYVTANLYLPEKRKGRIPFTLIPCGHSANGKSSVNYTKVAATLAANGIGSLCYDPVGQGERYQHSDFFGTTEGVTGHNQLGKKILASGNWFGAWRAYDATRALDYLMTRPEVNPKQVYVTGCSGGGTLTTWMTALEDRFAGALPSSYITSWEKNVENELPVDAEQVPPFLAGQGLEMGDFLIAAAPRPICVLDTDNDFFDPRGLKETMEDVRKIYKLLGAEKSAEYFIGQGDHGYNPDQREKCYQTMARWTGIKQTLREKDLTFPEEEEQYCAPKGHIWNLPGHRSAEEVLKEKYEAVISKRKDLKGKELEQALRKCLNLPEKLDCPRHRVLRPELIEECRIFLNRMLLETDRTVLGELRRFSPVEELLYHMVPAKSALLYLPHWNSPMEFPAVIAGMKQQYGAYYSFDPFGVGSLTPASCDWPMPYYGAPYRSDYHFDSLGVLLGEPYQGLRVEGVLRAIAFLRDAGTQEITLCGAGRSSVTASFAALLAGKQVKHTLLINPLESYESLPGKFTNWAQPEMPFGILKVTDLPRIREQIHAEVLFKSYINIER